MSASLQGKLQGNVYIDYIILMIFLYSGLSGLAFLYNCIITQITGQHDSRVVIYEREFIGNTVFLF